ncbi:phospholipase D-like domain-containing protein [Xylanimonas protaetiae]|uniref:Phosphatidylserine/phosphatidylglycerophosphate/ cardiolipin synthase family protein n=1 Tax=Xylanimonas protaetiae TaxID=2509457 RepID=A0A4P6F6J3_9MICO|nr:phospholipase D-like domain-containing protein [Xylanimonas protaetiae]QAY71056.1 phosphatidylserine/phosphatidylglycerophosphate/cardiolipin synthase family protein [Xylanimonas protaetiae]
MPRLTALTSRLPRLSVTPPAGIGWAGVRRAAARVGLVAAAVPVATGLALVAAERVRRHAHPLDAPFPTAPPAISTVGATTTTVYTFGDDLYAAMLDAIDAAQQRIFFETFIWKGDDVGQRFRDALEAAAARGVEVYVVYDAFANLVVRRSFFDLSARIHVLRFPWVRAGVLVSPLRASGRDHRKLLVVDDEIGFVGGYNIGALYARHWRDTHLRLAGPAVWELRNAFVDFWNRWRTPDLPVLKDVGSTTWLPQLRAARNSPSDLVFPIRNVYLDAIDRATSHVQITQAYFIPDREILAALLAAAGRGVDVRVLVPERSNHVVADWLARGHYATLLRGGVRIFLYTDAMIHAKTATVDGRWSTIGTANIDRLSLTGNYEINLEIVDTDVAATLERIFTMDLTNARELTREEWAARRTLNKVGERLVSPLAPFL